MLHSAGFLDRLLCYWIRVSQYINRVLPKCVSFASHFGSVVELARYSTFVEFGPENAPFYAAEFFSEEYQL